MSVMMITTSVFEKMCSRFEGAMGAIVTEKRKDR